LEADIFVKPDRPAQAILPAEKSGHGDGSEEGNDLVVDIQLVL
jgi:hypothetical protein